MSAPRRRSGSARFGVYEVPLRLTSIREYASGLLSSAYNFSFEGDDVVENEANVFLT
jgi:hypothetical protein